jgi:hypothetical protein
MTLHFEYSHAIGMLNVFYKVANILKSKMFL